MLQQMLLEQEDLTPERLAVAWKESVFWEIHAIHHVVTETTEASFAFEPNERFERLLLRIDCRLFSALYALIGLMTASVNFSRSIFLFVHFICVAQDVPPSAHFVLHLSNAYASFFRQGDVSFAIWITLAPLLMIGKYGSHPFHWRYQCSSLLMHLLDALITIRIWF